MTFAFELENMPSVILSHSQHFFVCAQLTGDTQCPSGVHQGGRFLLQNHASHENTNITTDYDAATQVLNVTVCMSTAVCMPRIPMWCAWNLPVGMPNLVC